MMKNTTSNSLPKVNVGDIYVASGGYDANFAFFYKIAKVTAKSAKLVPIGSKVVKAGENCMEHGSVVADETASAPTYRSASKMCRIKPSYREGEACFRVDNTGFCDIAYKWDGNPIRTYNYH